VVLVPFPFTDLSTQKLRPGVIVGRVIANEVLVAFITSRLTTIDAAAEHIIESADPEFLSTGLKVSSLVRLNRLAALERGLIVRRIGKVGPATTHAISDALRYVLEL
jgi:mRNA interferase MazF